MSLNHSPSIVRDGLVLYYDMSNTQKSFKGAPTTNITPDLGIVQVQSVSCTYVGVEDGWKKYALGGTWTAGGYPYAFAVDAFTCTGGVTYSTGIYIKTNVAPKFAALFTGMNYVNAPMNLSGTSFSIPQSDGSIFVGRYGFQYTSTSSQNGYLISQPVINQVFDSAKDFLYIKSGQIEQGSFCTPYVNGARTNTQAIVDLTGNNTLTANSLTYASNNTFSFNGSGNSIESPTSTLFNTQSLTMESWCKPTLTAQNGFLFEKGQVNTQYSNFFDANGIFYFRIMGLSIQDLSFTSASYVTANAWNNIVCTYGAGVKTIYVNGIQIAQQTGLTGTIPTGQTNQYIGKYGAAAINYPFNGSIAVSKVYNRALSTAEVKQNFDALRRRYGI